MRSQSTRPAAWWPAAGLLGLVLPLAFAERVQSYLHYLAPLELWPVFGTTILLHLPFALALLVMAWALGHALGKLPLSWQKGLGGRDVAPVLLLGAVLAFGLNFGLQLWLGQIDTSGRWAGSLPALRWWLLAAVIGVAAWPALRKAVSNLASLSKGLTLVGLMAVITLPFFGWRDAQSPAATPGSDKRPHLVLLTFDALAAQHLSLYGYARPTSPELDRFAASGVVFDRFYANSNFTTTTVNSIVSGRLPTEHRALQLHSWPLRIARDESLPAVLRQAGYRTYAVSTNPLAGPYKNGYGAHFDAVASDRIHTYFSGRDGPSRWLKYLGPVLDSPIINTMWRPISIARWRNREQQNQNLHYDPRLAFDAARTLITNHSGGPLFLWVHLLPPHSPYAAPVPYLGQFEAAPDLRSWSDSSPPFLYEWAQVTPALQHVYKARYDESIRYVDAAAGEFFKELRTLLGENLVIAVSADHGESFSHGYGGHAGPLLTEGLVRIPLIVQGPGLVAGTRVGQVSSQIDLAPTLAALAGAAKPPGWIGRSLLPQLQGEESDSGAAAWTMNLEQNPRFGPIVQGTVSRIESRWKYVRLLGAPRYPGMPPPKDQLFDLLRDPGELENVAGSNPSEAARLRAEIDSFIEAGHSPSP